MHEDAEVVRNKELMRALAKQTQHPDRLMGNFACDRELAHTMHRLLCCTQALSILCGYVDGELWHPERFDPVRVAFVTEVCSRPLRLQQQVLWIDKANSVHQVHLLEHDAVSMKCRVRVRLGAREMTITVPEHTLVPCEAHDTTPLEYEHLNAEACRDEHFLRWMPSAQCYVLAHAMYMTKAAQHALARPLSGTSPAHNAHVIPDDRTMEALYPPLNYLIDACRARAGNMRLHEIRLYHEQCSAHAKAEYAADSDDSEKRSVIINLSDNQLAMRIAGVTRNIELVEPGGCTVGACFTLPASIYRSKTAASYSTPAIGTHARALYLVLIYANPKRAAEGDELAQIIARKKQLVA